MSARTPFFPSGGSARPPTRNATQTTADATADATSTGQGGGGPQNVVAAFQADPSNPLHSGQKQGSKNGGADALGPVPGADAPRKNGLAALNAKKKGSKGPLAGGFGSGFGGNSGGENLNDMPPPRPGTADPQGRLRHSGSGSFGIGGRHGNSGSGNGFTSSFGSHRAQREGTNAGPKIMAPIPMQAPSSLLRLHCVGWAKMALLGIGLRPLKRIYPPKMAK
ncbi:hypothetical protein DFP72DRAFT_1063414 [Ephemerocybe angulata]|uniref:Uncharacterized protein n=1 Tax=Ephemerocybe angulata TaxID=980116 RepID=A0A8H6I689_9AGAR|nr:hypothetical protein DFP72DRAFT_1063414 [Tulosesus angulatus]